MNSETIFVLRYSWYISSCKITVGQSQLLTVN